MNAFKVANVFARTLNSAAERVFSCRSAKLIGGGDLATSQVVVTENVRDLQGARGD